MKYINFSDISSWKYNNIVLGATVVIGVIGGIYLLTQGTKTITSRIAERKANKKKRHGQICNVCFTPLDTEDSKTCIACCSCAKYVCCGGENCSELVPNDGGWMCKLCSARSESYGKTSSWIEEQYSVQRALPAYAHPLRARSEIYIPLCDPNESAFLCNFESVSEAPSPINSNQKQQIREYIEEVLAEMLGGSLDSASVGKLSQNENCQQVGNGHELHGISNVRLRQLIESIIAETLRQPPFLPLTENTEETRRTTTLDNGHHPEVVTINGSYCNGDSREYFEPKKYQDLLATAVLNKIVTTHGNGNGRLSESSPDLTSSALDNNHNALSLNKTDESISSGSSVEPRSESSLTDPIHNINKDDETSQIGSFGNYYADVANENIEADRESVLSDFIASHMVPLPQISAEPASEEEVDDEDEDFISVSSSREATWEDNWLFKKKRSGKTSSSVGMLVPAPREDVRTLIGDKPTDEVSDLSEVGSDTDDSSLEMISASLEPLNDRLVNQHLIGGKNTKIVLDELVEHSSMNSTSSWSESVPPYTETKNDFVVSNDGLEPSKISVSKCNTNINNEAINTEVTKTVPNRTLEKSETESQIPQDESLVPPPNDFTDDEKMRNLLAKFNEDQKTKADSEDDNSNSSSLSPHSSISCALSAAIGRADLDEHEGITNFCITEDDSTAENDESMMGESSSRRPSVIEILAAIALGPMLAVSASDDRNILSDIEVSSLMELNELAMAELNAKNAEERNARLDVIEEESFDSGTGEEAKVGTSNNFGGPSYLNSPDMVMKAIKELVGDEAFRFRRVDDDYDNDGGVIIEEIDERTENFLNELKIEEDIKKGRQEGLEDNIGNEESTIITENASVPGNEEQIVKADLNVESENEEIETKCPSQENEDLNDELQVKNTEIENQHDIVLQKAENDSSSSKDEENLIANSATAPSSNVNRENNVNILADETVKSNTISNSISNESLRTIESSSDNFEDCETEMKPTHEMFPSLQELSEEKLNELKSKSNIAETDMNNLILPPPMQFCDDIQTNESEDIQQKKTHIAQSNIAVEPRKLGNKSEITETFDSDTMRRHDDINAHKEDINIIEERRMNEEQTIMNAEEILVEKACILEAKEIEESKEEIDIGESENEIHVANITTEDNVGSPLRDIEPPDININKLGNKENEKIESLQDPQLHRSTEINKTENSVINEATETIQAVEMEKSCVMESSGQQEGELCAEKTLKNNDAAEKSVFPMAENSPHQLKSEKDLDHPDETLNKNELTFDRTSNKSLELSQSDSQVTDIIEAQRTEKNHEYTMTETSVDDGDTKNKYQESKIIEPSTKYDQPKQMSEISLLNSELSSLDSTLQLRAGNEKKTNEEIKVGEEGAPNTKDTDYENAHEASERNEDESESFKFNDKEELGLGKPLTTALSEKPNLEENKSGNSSVHVTISDQGGSSQDIEEVLERNKVTSCPTTSNIVVLEPPQVVETKEQQSCDQILTPSIETNIVHQPEPIPLKQTEETEITEKSSSKILTIEETQPKSPVDGTQALQVNVTEVSADTVELEEKQLSVVPAPLEITELIEPDSPSTSELTNDNKAKASQTNNSEEIEMFQETKSRESDTKELPLESVAETLNSVVLSTPACDDMILKTIRIENTKDTEITETVLTNAAEKDNLDEKKLSLESLSVENIEPVVQELASESENPNNTETNYSEKTKISQENKNKYSETKELPFESVTETDNLGVVCDDFALKKTLVEDTKQTKITVNQILSPNEEQTVNTKEQQLSTSSSLVESTEQIETVSSVLTNDNEDKVAQISNSEQTESSEESTSKYSETIDVRSENAFATRSLEVKVKVEGTKGSDVTDTVSTNVAKPTSLEENQFSGEHTSAEGIETKQSVLSRPPELTNESEYNASLSEETQSSQDSKSKGSEPKDLLAECAIETVLPIPTYDEINLTTTKVEETKQAEITETESTNVPDRTNLKAEQSVQSTLPASTESVEPASPSLAEMKSDNGNKAAQTINSKETESSQEIQEPPAESVTGTEDLGIQTTSLCNDIVLDTAKVEKTKQADISDTVLTKLAETDNLKEKQLIAEPPSVESAEPLEPVLDCHPEVTTDCHTKATPTNNPEEIESSQETESTRPETKGPPAESVTETENLEIQAISLCENIVLNIPKVEDSKEIEITETISTNEPETVNLEEKQLITETPSVEKTKPLEPGLACHPEITSDCHAKASKTNNPEEIESSQETESTTSETIGPPAESVIETENLEIQTTSLCNDIVSDTAKVKETKQADISETVLTKIDETVTLEGKQLIAEPPSVESTEPLEPGLACHPEITSDCPAKASPTNNPEEIESFQETESMKPETKGPPVESVTETENLEIQTTSVCNDIVLDTAKVEETKQADISETVLTKIDETVNLEEKQLIVEPPSVESTEPLEPGLACHSEITSDCHANASQTDNREEIKSSPETETTRPETKGPPAESVTETENLENQATSLCENIVLNILKVEESKEIEMTETISTNEPETVNLEEKQLTAEPPSVETTEPLDPGLACHPEITSDCHAKASQTNNTEEIESSQETESTTPETIGPPAESVTETENLEIQTTSLCNDIVSDTAKVEEAKQADISETVLTKMDETVTLEEKQLIAEPLSVESTEPLEPGLACHPEITSDCPAKASPTNNPEEIESFQETESTKPETKGPPAESVTEAENVEIKTTPLYENIVLNTPKVEESKGVEITEAISTNEPETVNLKEKQLIGEPLSIERTELLDPGLACHPEITKDCHAKASQTNNTEEIESSQETENTTPETIGPPAESVTETENLEIQTTSLCNDIVLDTAKVEETKQADISETVLTKIDETVNLEEKQLIVEPPSVESTESLDPGLACHPEITSDCHAYASQTDNPEEIKSFQETESTRPETKGSPAESVTETENLEIQAISLCENIVLNIPKVEESKEVEITETLSTNEPKTVNLEEKQLIAEPPSVERTEPLETGLACHPEITSDCHAKASQTNNTEEIESSQETESTTPERIGPLAESVTETENLEIQTTSLCNDIVSDTAKVEETKQADISETVLMKMNETVTLEGKQLIAEPPSVESMEPLEPGLACHPEITSDCPTKASPTNNPEEIESFQETESTKPEKKGPPAESVTETENLEIQTTPLCENIVLNTTKVEESKEVEITETISTNEPEKVNLEEKQMKTEPPSVEWTEPLEPGLASQPEITSDCHAKASQTNNTEEIESSQETESTTSETKGSPAESVSETENLEIQATSLCENIVLNIPKVEESKEVEMTETISTNEPESVTLEEKQLISEPPSVESTEPLEPGLACHPEITSDCPAKASPTNNLEEIESFQETEITKPEMKGPPAESVTETEILEIQTTPLCENIVLNTPKVEESKEVEITETISTNEPETVNLEEKLSMVEPPSVESTEPIVPVSACQPEITSNNEAQSSQTNSSEETESFQVSMSKESASIKLPKESVTGTENLEMQTTPLCDETVVNTTKMYGTKKGEIDETATTNATNTTKVKVTKKAEIDETLSTKVVEADYENQFSAEPPLVEGTEHLEPVSARPPERKSDNEDETRLANSKEETKSSQETKNEESSTRELLTERRSETVPSAPISDDIVLNTNNVDEIEQVEIDETVSTKEAETVNLEGKQLKAETTLEESTDPIEPVSLCPLEIKIHSEDRASQKINSAETETSVEIENKESETKQPLEENVSETGNAVMRPMPECCDTETTKLSAESLNETTHSTPKSKYIVSNTNKAEQTKQVEITEIGDLNEKERTAKLSSVESKEPIEPVSSGIPEITSDNETQASQINNSEETGTSQETKSNELEKKEPPSEGITKTENLEKQTQTTPLSDTIIWNTAKVKESKEVEITETISSNAAETFNLEENNLIAEPLSVETTEPREQVLVCPLKITSDNDAKVFQANNNEETESTQETERKKSETKEPQAESTHHLKQESAFQPKKTSDNEAQSSQTNNSEDTELYKEYKSTKCATTELLAQSVIETVMSTPISEHIVLNTTKVEETNQAENDETVSQNVAETVNFEEKKQLMAEQNTVRTTEHIEPALVCPPKLDSDSEAQTNNSEETESFQETKCKESETDELPVKCGTETENLDIPKSLPCDDSVRNTTEPLDITSDNIAKPSQTNNAQETKSSQETMSRESETEKPPAEGVIETENLEKQTQTTPLCDTIVLNTSKVEESKQVEIIETVLSNVAETVNLETTSLCKDCVRNTTNVEEPKKAEIEERVATNVAKADILDENKLSPNLTSVKTTKPLEPELVCSPEMKSDNEAKAAQTNNSVESLPANECKESEAKEPLAESTDSIEPVSGCQLKLTSVNEGQSSQTNNRKETESSLETKSKESATIEFPTQSETESVIINPISDDIVLNNIQFEQTKQTEITDTVTAKVAETIILEDKQFLAEPSSVKTTESIEPVLDCPPKESFDNEAKASLTKNSEDTILSKETKEPPVESVLEANLEIQKRLLCDDVIMNTTKVEDSKEVEIEETVSTNVPKPVNLEEKQLSAAHTAVKGTEPIEPVSARSLERTIESEDRASLANNSEEINSPQEIKSKESKTTVLPAKSVTETKHLTPKSNDIDLNTTKVEEAKQEEITATVSTDIAEAAHLHKNEVVTEYPSTDSTEPVSPCDNETQTNNRETESSQETKSQEVETKELQAKSETEIENLEMQTITSSDDIVFRTAKFDGSKQAEITETVSTNVAETVNSEEKHLIAKPSSFESTESPENTSDNESKASQTNNVVETESSQETKSKESETNGSPAEVVTGTENIEMQTQTSPVSNDIVLNTASVEERKQADIFDIVSTKVPKTTYLEAEQSDQRTSIESTESIEPASPRIAEMTTDNEDKAAQTNNRKETESSQETRNKESETKELPAESVTETENLEIHTTSLCNDIVLDTAKVEEIREADISETVNLEEKLLIAEPPSVESTEHLEPGLACHPEITSDCPAKASPTNNPKEIESFQETESTKMETKRPSAEGVTETENLEMQTTPLCENIVLNTPKVEESKEVEITETISTNEPETVNLEEKLSTVEHPSVESTESIVPVSACHPEITSNNEAESSQTNKSEETESSQVSMSKESEAIKLPEERVTETVLSTLISDDIVLNTTYVKETNQAKIVETVSKNVVEADIIEELQLPAEPTSTPIHDILNATEVEETKQAKITETLPTNVAQSVNLEENQLIVEPPSVESTESIDSEVVCNKVQASQSEGCPAERIDPIEHISAWQYKTTSDNKTQCSETNKGEETESFQESKNKESTTTELAAESITATLLSNSISNDIVNTTYIEETKEANVTETVSTNVDERGNFKDSSDRKTEIDETVSTKVVEADNSEENQVSADVSSVQTTEPLDPELVCPLKIASDNEAKASQANNSEETETSQEIKDSPGESVTEAEMLATSLCYVSVKNTTMVEETKKAEINETISSKVVEADNLEENQVTNEPSLLDGTEHIEQVSACPTERTKESEDKAYLPNSSEETESSQETKNKESETTELLIDSVTETVSSTSISDDIVLNINVEETKQVVSTETVSTKVAETVNLEEFQLECVFEIVNSETQETRKTDIYETVSTAVSETINFEEEHLLAEPSPVEIAEPKEPHLSSSSEIRNNDLANPTHHAVIEENSENICFKACSVTEEIESEETSLNLLVEETEKCKTSYFHENNKSNENEKLDPAAQRGIAKHDQIQKSQTVKLQKGTAFEESSDEPITEQIKSEEILVSDNYSLNKASLDPSTQTPEIKHEQITDEENRETKAEIHSVESQREKNHLETSFSEPNLKQSVETQASLATDNSNVTSEQNISSNPMVAVEKIENFEFSLETKNTVEEQKDIVFTAENTSSGIRIRTINDFTSEVSEATTEIKTQSQEVISSQEVTLKATDSLNDSAQNPSEIYSTISHPALDVSPCLAEELRMADNNIEAENSDATKSKSKDTFIEIQSSTQNINDSVAKDQSDAQGNQSEITFNSTSSSFNRNHSTHLKSSNSPLPPPPPPNKNITTKTKDSGSQFRKLTLCDKRFLAELEKHRKQRELIQNYLDTLDTIETPSYLTEDLYLESKCYLESSLYSLFSEPSDFYIVGATRTSSSAKMYFLNSILFSDRISSESNCTDNSTPTVIDTFGSSMMESDSDEDLSRDESTKHYSNKVSTTATTTNNGFITTNNVTNKSHINSPTPQPLAPPPELRTESACSKLYNVETRAAGEYAEHVDDDPLKHLVPGSIAEREYKKWYNAVDMPNNPYSVEALKRRLSGGPEKVIDLPNISPSIEENPLKLGEDENTEVDNTRDYARYSRDYYINDAKHASGTTKKSPTSPTLQTPTKAPSSIEIEEHSESIVENQKTSPTVKETCRRLENQSKNQEDSDIYLATPVKVDEYIPIGSEALEESLPTVSGVEFFTTDVGVSKLISETSSTFTTESLTPSEDSDTIRIYDLKSQETRLVKENQTSKVSILRPKARPTELEITPVVTAKPFASTSKSSTPTSFKFLQPKRKLIDPSQVLSIDLDTTPVPTPTTEKAVIEEEVVQSLPSVKALAQAFLMTSSTCSSSDKWRKARTKSPIDIFKPKPKPPTTTTTKVLHKQTEAVIADTTSQGSEDATIASDLSSLEIDPPSKQDTNSSALNRQSSQERPLSPVLVRGGLKNNIAFFENLKNK